MKRYLERGALVVACILFLTAGTTGSGNCAESEAAKENLQKLIKTRSCRGCDLAGLILNRVNLAGADLEGADFSMAKFLLCNLAGANLRNANLQGSSFGGSDLGEADLRGADLRGASLDGAYLGGTLLDGEFVTAKPFEDIGVADLEKKIYIGDPGKPKKSPETKAVKIAEDGDVTEPPSPLAVQPEAPKLPSGKNVETGRQTAGVPVAERQPDAPAAKKAAPVRQAIVEPNEKEEKADAVPAEIHQTVAAVPGEKEGNDDGGQMIDAAAAIDATTAGSPPEKPIADGGVGESSKLLAMEKSKRDTLSRLLDKGKCFECDLSGLDLSGKNLKNADLEKADLTGCNLERVNLDTANLKGTSLRNANLRRASLKNADLYKADLSGADLTDANVQGAMFDNAKIDSAVGLETVDQ